jgi:cell division protein FtsL
MIRPSTILWLVLVTSVGFGMFEVKYAVSDLEDTLAKTNKAIVADQDAIHVLKAEWSYLSQPSRLEELARRYLDLQPLGTAQLAQPSQLDAIAMRLAPPAAVATADAAQQAVTPAAPAAQPKSPAPTTKQLPAATRIAAAKLRTEP